MARVQRFVSFLWQNCGDFYTKDGELAFDRPGAKQAVEDYAALNKYAPAGSHSWGSRDPVHAYIGRAASPWRSIRAGLAYEVATNAPDIAKVTGNREARVARGGKGPRVAYGAITGYAIGSTVSNPEEAKKFLKFLFTGQPLLEYAMGVPGHVAPAIKEIQAQVLEQDHPYIKEHRDWVESIFEATTYANPKPRIWARSPMIATSRNRIVPMPWSAAGHGPGAGGVDACSRRSPPGPPCRRGLPGRCGAFTTEMEAWKQENNWFSLRPELAAARHGRGPGPIAGELDAHMSFRPSTDGRT